MGRALRIAYLADFSPKKLGTGENRLVMLAKELNRHGHTMTLFCRQPIHMDVARAFNESGVTIEDLGSVAARPIAWAMRLSRGFDVIQLNAIAPRGRPALAAYAAWPAKVLFVDHISPPAQEPAHAERPLLRRWVDALTMSRVWQAAGVSNFVRRRLQERFALPAHRVLTMYGGVDTDRFRPPTSQPGKSGTVQITAVAALIPEKGLDVLRRALARGDLPPWRLRIVGDGPDRPRLEGLVSSLGLGQQLEFTGLRDDVDDILRETDVFVHPAVWQEALGYTILEGMASGCAVIATRTGGIPELVRDGQEGLLVPPGDEAALETALRRLAEDPELRSRLGASARKRVTDQFTLQQNVARTVDWFEAAADSSPINFD